jgi:aspartate/methionine/tyrosine aminotransferase
VEFAGAKLKTVPFKIESDKWEYDFDAFERAITPKTKVVMITNPHNPTGKIFNKSELEKLTRILEKHP